MFPGIMGFSTEAIFFLPNAFSILDHFVLNRMHGVEKICVLL